MPRLDAQLLLAVLSVAIAVMAIPSPWMQAARILKKRCVTGLSGAYLLTILWSSMIWTVYGLLRHDALQNIVNIPCGFAYGIMTAAACVFGAMKARWVVPTTMVFLGGLALLTLAGPAAVGATATIVALGCRIPQSMKAWRDPGGLAISVHSFLYGSTVAFAWLGWGVLAHDWWVAATALHNALHGLFVAARTIHARRNAAVVKSAPLLAAA